MGYLFETKRHRLVLPHRLVDALVSLLGEALKLLDAVGAHLEDDRWREAAAKIQSALEELRKPGAEHDRILRIEQREREESTRTAMQQHIAELARASVNVEAMKKDRDQRKREQNELEETRKRLEARRRRLDREYERTPERGSIRLPPRKPVVFVREVAARLLRR